MSANVGTLVTGAARRPTRWKAILIGGLIAVGLAIGALLLTRPSAPVPVARTPHVTAYVLPSVTQTGKQFASTSSRHPELARRKFGVLPTSGGHAKGPFVRRKWGR